MAASTELKMKTKNKKIISAAAALLGLLLFIRIFCGIFVIQPIGAIPEGVTIVYWRTGLNLPFVTSADGFLIDSGVGISLLSRGMTLAKLSEPILEKEIMRFSYSETLYLWSTGGKQFNR